MVLWKSAQAPAIWGDAWAWLFLRVCMELSKSARACAIAETDTELRQVRPPWGVGEPPKRGSVGVPGDTTALLSCAPGDVASSGARGCAQLFRRRDWRWRRGECCCCCCCCNNGSCKDGKPGEAASSISCCSCEVRSRVTSVARSRQTSSRSLSALLPRARCEWQASCSSASASNAALNPSNARRKPPSPAARRHRKAAAPLSSIERAPDAERSACTMTSKASFRRCNAMA